MTIWTILQIFRIWVAKMATKTLINYDSWDVLIIDILAFIFINWPKHTAHPIFLILKMCSYILPLRFIYAVLLMFIVAEKFCQFIKSHKHARPPTTESLYCIPIHISIWTVVASIRIILFLLHLLFSFIVQLDCCKSSRIDGTWKRVNGMRYSERWQKVV